MQLRALCVAAIELGHVPPDAFGDLALTAGWYVPILNGGREYGEPFRFVTGRSQPPIADVALPIAWRDALRRSRR
jgi:hypothetical protein